MDRYLAHFILASFIIALIVASINWVGDPYAIYRSDTTLSMQSSPLLIANERVFKTVRLAQSEADIVLLGTSRVDLGLAVNNPYFFGKRVINLASYAQSIEETFQLLKHHLSNSISPDRKQVFVGLDFFAFNALASYPSDYDELNYSETRALQLLLSFTGFSESIKLLLNTRSAEMNACCDAQGFRYRSTYEQLAGHYQASFSKFVKGFLTENDKWLSGQECRFSFQNTHKRDTLDAFRALVKLAYANRVDLKMYISPAHAWIWEALASAGLWEQWETWKSAMVNISIEEANIAGQLPFPVWDFSGYDQFSTEVIPDKDDRVSLMQWYLDSSHYSPELGEHIIARITNTEKNKLFSDWGILLSESIMGPHFQAVKSARARYEISHPGDLKEIMSIVRSVEEKRECPFKFTTL